MSLDSIIQTESSSQSSGYGKNQRGDRNQRRQKPYQRQPRSGNGQQQPSAASNPSSAQQQMSPALLQQQQQQQLQTLLSMPLSSFPQVLQQLSLQPFPPSSQPFPLSLPTLHPLSTPTPTDVELDPSSTSSRTLKVSATSDAKRVAGSISHTSRLGACPTLLATGQASLNQAIKAIAIARTYLEDNRVDLSVKSEFRDEERGAVSMVLTKSALRKKAAGGGGGGGGAAGGGAAGGGGGGGGGEEKEVEESELRVAQNSEPSHIAGSIAKKIRGGERVSIVSIGAGSVSATVRAITIARRYLEGDNLDVSFKPSFVHLEMEDGQRSGIKFVILAQQV